MKNFFMKNWRKVIIGIGIIAIIYNLIMTVITPATIPEDFYKYGPANQEDVIDIVTGVDANEGLNDATTKFSIESGLSEHISKPLIIFSVIFCLLLILDNMMSGGAAAAKKK